MCLMSYANNKGADQPAHPRSLISAFVVRCLDSAMSLVSVTKISSLMLASVAEQARLSLTWSETPENTFCHDEAQLIIICCIIYTIKPDFIKSTGDFDDFLRWFQKIILPIFNQFRIVLQVPNRCWRICKNPLDDAIALKYNSISLLYYEPRHEKTWLRGFRPGHTQTGLLSYRYKLESWNFGF